MTYTPSQQGVRFSPDAVLHLWTAWSQFRARGCALVVVPQPDGRTFAYGGDPSPDSGALPDELNGHDFFWYVDDDRRAELRSTMLIVSEDGNWLERAR